MSAVSAISSGHEKLNADAGRLRINNLGDGSFYKALMNASQGERREAAEVAAKQLVSSALVMPVLESMRESTFNTDGPFAPGMVEERFAPMLDQHLADRITGASNFHLIDEIVDRYMGPAEENNRGGAETQSVRKDLYG